MAVGLLMQQASASASQPIWGGVGAAEQLGDHLHTACPASNTKQSSWKCQQQQQQRTMGENVAEADQPARRLLTLIVASWLCHCQRHRQGCWSLPRPALPCTKAGTHCTVSVYHINLSAPMSQAGHQEHPLQACRAHLCRPAATQGPACRVQAHTRGDRRSRGPHHQSGLRLQPTAGSSGPRLQAALVGALVGQGHCT